MKTVLVAGILVLLAAFAAVTGALAVRWLGVGLAVFGALRLSAAASQPPTTPANVLPTLADVVAVAVVLTVLIRAAAVPQPVLRAIKQAPPGDRAGPSSAADDGDHRCSIYPCPSC